MAGALPENAVAPATRAAWRQWLTRHHTRNRGVWFVDEAARMAAANQRIGQQTSAEPRVQPAATSRGVPRPRRTKACARG